MRTISITVKGRVQGVNFRYFTKTKADTIGVTGTVKNLPNGDVFIIATGEDYQLNDLFEYCKDGPSRAEVTGIIKEDIELKIFTWFEIVR
ncbi:MAG: acylphosphatase [Sphingobacteriales bacterium]|nr:acylphosphatase [Sphingobacteriales bacterium]